MHPTSRILLPKLQSLVNYMKHKELLDAWKKKCKRWRSNKLDHLLLSMMGILLIDHLQEPLQVILAVKKSIGEGGIHHNFMDKDLIIKEKDITTTMVTTKMQRLGYLRSSFLVLMALVILMYI